MWTCPQCGREFKRTAQGHFSFYVGLEARGEFSSELNEFVTKRNAIYFPYNKALPTKLITTIAKWCLS